MHPWISLWLQDKASAYEHVQLSSLITLASQISKAVGVIYSTSIYCSLTLHPHSCPVCRYTQTPEAAGDNTCTSCDSVEVMEGELLHGDHSPIPSLHSIVTHKSHSQFPFHSNFMLGGMETGDRGFKYQIHTCTFVCTGPVDMLNMW